MEQSGNISNNDKPEWMREWEEFLQEEGEYEWWLSLDEDEQYQQEMDRGLRKFQERERDDNR